MCDVLSVSNDLNIEFEFQRRRLLITRPSNLPLRRIVYLLVVHVLL